MEENKTESDNLKMLKKHVSALGEHFDSVMIFVTRAEDGGTSYLSYGEGNWFTRYGQVKEWIVREEAWSRKTALEGED